MPATSPNWYFVWQALSHCHSPDFPAGRARPCFDSHFCCFLLLPGRITQSQRSGERCTWGDSNCQRYLCSNRGVFSVAQGAGPGPLGWVLKRFSLNGGISEIISSRKRPSKQLGDFRLLSSGNFLRPATVSHPPCHSQHPNGFQSCSQVSTP